MSAEAPVKGSHPDGTDRRLPRLGDVAAGGTEASAGSPPVRPATLLLTAAVAGVFSIIVCALLLINFAHRIPDPLTTPSYANRKTELRNQPGSETLKQEI